LRYVQKKKLGIL